MAFRRPSRVHQPQRGRWTAASVTPCSWGPIRPAHRYWDPIPFALWQPPRTSAAAGALTGRGPICPNCDFAGGPSRSRRCQPFPGRRGRPPLPLSEVWRGHLDDDLDRRLRAMQKEAERLAGLNSVHLDALQVVPCPQRYKGLGALPCATGAFPTPLDVYVSRVPDAIAEEEATKYRGESVGELLFRVGRRH